MTDREIGWMAAAVTISDIAAMGARPVALLLATGLDRPERLAGTRRGRANAAGPMAATMAGGTRSLHPK